MPLIEMLQRFIFSTSRRVLVSSIITLTVLKSGVWMMTNLNASRQLAENPFANPFSNVESGYLVWNWLGPFIAWSISATTPMRFFVLHLAFAFAFVLLVVHLSFSRLSDRNARVALVIFALLPVSATSFFYVGMDGLTLFLMGAAFVFPRQPAWALSIGTFLGMQHFEQGIVAAALLVLVVAGKRRVGDETNVSVIWCCCFAIGVLAGKGCLVALFNHFDMAVSVERGYWIRVLWPSVLKAFMLHPHHTLWSVLALGWIVLIMDISRGRTAIPLIVALLTSSVLLILVFDQTRVLAIVTFPFLSVSWLQHKGTLEVLDDRFVALLFMAWLFVPWAWTFGGFPQWSVLPYDLAFLIGTLTDWYELPNDLAWWPFHFVRP